MKNCNLNLVLEGSSKILKIVPDPVGVLEYQLPSVYISDCLEHNFIVIDSSTNKPITLHASIFDSITKWKYSSKSYNHTFWHNFAEVANMSDEEYYSHQILHYFSTYGLESLGLNAIPYIPASALVEKTNVDLKDCNIDIIRQVTFEDYVVAIRDYLLNVKNPNNNYTQYYKEFLLLIKDVGISIDDTLFKSYEMKCLYYDVFNSYPSKPIDVLRYMVYLATNSNLLIKNLTTIQIIKGCMKAPFGNKQYAKIIEIFNEYDLTKFAKIFYRFKPLFLAFKVADTKSKINRIRKLAPKYHEPLTGLSVQNLVELYINDFCTDSEVIKFIKDIDYRNIFKLVNFICNVDSEYKVYSIRNGKSYVKEDIKTFIKPFIGTPKLISPSKLKTLLQILVNEIKVRYQDRFNGKVIYIPKHISYSLPISEKQMVGNYPNGTSIIIGANPCAIGVAWYNKSKTDDRYNGRVDIDLHLMGIGTHYGWNASRQEKADIVYSGDQTDGVNGAAEAFWINNMDKDYVLTASLYTSNGPVDFNLFVNKKEIKNRSMSYVYSPDEDLIPTIPLTINDSLNIGLYHYNKLFFYNKTISSGIVPQEHYDNFIKGLTEKMDSTQSLKSLLELLGAKIVQNKDTKIDYDLDPQVIDQTSLFKLFD